MRVTIRRAVFALVLISGAAGCERKAEKYIRLHRTLDSLTAQSQLAGLQRDSLTAVIERARVTPGMEADAIRAMTARDSLGAAATLRSIARERTEAELAVLR